MKLVVVALTVVAMALLCKRSLHCSDVLHDRLGSALWFLIALVLALSVGLWLMRPRRNG